MVFLIGEAIAGGMQQTVMTNESLMEVVWILAGMALIAMVFGWAVTQIAKRWRKDHGVQKLLPSSSYIRAMLLTTVAFLGLWYVAHSFDIIRINDWITGFILSVIIGGISPLAWNPLLAKLKKHAPGVAAAIEKVQE